MNVWKLLLYGIVAFIIIVYVSVRVNQRKQNKRLQEARVRGIKRALEEQKQYEALNKFGGEEYTVEPVEEYNISQGFGDLKGKEEE